MSARRAKNKKRTLLTDRSLRDITEIQEYGVAEWSERQAAKYLADVEAALLRLQEKPELLRRDEDFHQDLRFYRVGKHLLVCDVQPKAIFLLTVIHASRDIPSRLAEMAPILAAEAALLHAKLRLREKR